MPEGNLTTKSQLKVIAFSAFIVCGGWILIVLSAIWQAWCERNKPKPAMRPRYHARLVAEPTGRRSVHDLAEWRAWGYIARVDHRVQARVDVRADGPLTAIATAFDRGAEACDRSIGRTGNRESSSTSSSRRASNAAGRLRPARTPAGNAGINPPPEAPASSSAPCTNVASHPHAKR